MSDIGNTHIRKLDMTLLLIFQALMRHRKLTEAAKQLGLTQSAVSHNLRRLREVFGDELFLRRPAGVEPTARALELEPQVRALLDLARQAVRGKAFVAAEARGILRVAAPDYHSTLLAAPLIERVQRQAPNVQLSFRPLVRRQAIEALEAGEVDIALGFFPGTGERFRRRVLFEDGYAVVARCDHPLLRKKTLALKDYLDAQHIVVSLDGAVSGIVDRVLARAGHSRKLVAAVPFFVTALAAASTSDLIATVPQRLARAFAPVFGLRWWEPPVRIRPYQVSMLWHRRNDTSALHGWVMDEIAAISSPHPPLSSPGRRTGRSSRR